MPFLRTLNLNIIQSIYLHVFFCIFLCFFLNDPVFHSNSVWKLEIGDGTRQ